MQFNSIEFLFLFLPVFLAGYYLFKGVWRTGFLVLGSLVFYGLSCGGRYWWLGLLAAVTLWSYGSGILLEKKRNPWIFAGCIGVLAAALVFLKLYRGGIYLPAGASFFLFQAGAYIISLYRHNLPAEKNLLHHCAHIMMFPKLLSGPLMEPRDLQNQSRNVRLSREKLHDGLQLLILGLGMKVLLANRLGGLWVQPGVLGYETISTAAAWLAILGYTMQLYFDFYGYSLMAMGIGKLLGYELPENFRDPYISKTVSEFYRRWHVTLGAWFRENLYIPLGGSRKGDLRTILNLAVVWAFTGLWHGTGGNYLLWAGFLFLMILLERLFLGKWLNRSKVLCHVYLVFVIVLSWIPFAMGNWDEMTVFCSRLFGIGGNLYSPFDFGEWITMYAGLLVAGVALMTPVPRKWLGRLRNTVLGDILLVVLFWAVVYYISTAAQDPFMYFQF